MEKKGINWYIWLLALNSITNESFHEPWFHLPQIFFSIFLLFFLQYLRERERENTFERGERERWRLLRIGRLLISFESDSGLLIDSLSLPGNRNILWIDTHKKTNSVWLPRNCRKTKEEKKINTFWSEREMERSRRKCSFEREIQERRGGGHDRCRGGAHYGFHGDRLGPTERR